MPSLIALRSPIRPAAEWLFNLGKSWDRTLRITSVRRSWAEQDQLYNRFKRGLTKLPVAPPGHSLHQYGLAFDMARPGIEPYSDSLLPQLGAIWNSIGGTWHASDPVHFEVRPGPGR